jgi:hypothetical protein
MEKHGIRLRGGVAFGGKIRAASPLQLIDSIDGKYMIFF